MPLGYLLVREVDLQCLFCIPKLLEEGDTDCNGSAAPQLLAEEIAPASKLESEEALARVVALLHDLLDLDFGDDATVLGLDAVVVGREAAETGEGLQSLLRSVDEGEPTRGVGVEVDADAEEGGADHLQTEGQAEGHFTGHVAGAVGDEEADDNAGDDRDGLQNEEGSS